MQTVSSVPGSPAGGPVFDHPLVPGSLSSISITEINLKPLDPIPPLDPTGAGAPRGGLDHEGRLRPGRDTPEEASPLRAPVATSISSSSLLGHKMTSRKPMTAFENDTEQRSFHTVSDREFKVLKGPSSGVAFIDSHSDAVGSIQKVPLNDTDEFSRVKHKTSFRRSLVKMLDSFHGSSSTSTIESGTSSGASVERAKSLKEPSGRKRAMAERALTLIRAKSPPLQTPNATPLEKGYSTSHDPYNSTNSYRLSEPLPLAPIPLNRSPTPLLLLPSIFKSLSAPMMRSRDTLLEKASAGGGTSSPNSLVLLNGLDTDDEDDFDKMIAIFVARFDTLRGNMIEYQYPVEADLSGIEYQSLPSGSHAVMSDVIYFRKGPYYGICAFQRHVLTARDAEMQKERGARVRSVGILSTSFPGLHRHMPFLRSMANAFSVNLGEHYDLKTYFEARSLEVFPRIGLIESVGLPELQVLNVNSKFFINVADIVELEQTKSFLACTTESIFGSKQQLWDLYVHHQDTTAQLIFSTTPQKCETTGEATAPIKFPANEADNKRFTSEFSPVFDSLSSAKDIPSASLGIPSIREEDSSPPKGNYVISDERESRGAFSLADVALKGTNTPLFSAPKGSATDVGETPKFETVSQTMKAAISLVQ
ncbi:hypothetical protein BC829DRAFT_445838 [Chytridium lagenaria]|nr:hypothetical protein BC829DRAFT_445838 [Chytridium lagenaria]